MKYCIITLNWDSLVVMLSIGWLCGARYSISGYIVEYWMALRGEVFHLWLFCWLLDGFAGRGIPSLVILLVIGWLCGARYSISSYIVGYWMALRGEVFHLWLYCWLLIQLLC